MQAGLKERMILGSPVVACLLILLWILPAAAARVPAHERDHPSGNLEREACLAAIRSVLARKSPQPVVPERLEEKLSTLSDEQLRLIGSLAERIADGKPTVAADIAFLLLTVLIITL